MKRLDDTPIDPEIAASLDAIDATLAGEPVDPKYAEFAELALLLAADRPQPRAEFERALDARVARRFAPAPSAAADASGGGRRRRLFRWSLAPAWGSAAVAAVVLGVVVANLGGGGTPTVHESSGFRSGPGIAAGSTLSTASTPASTPKAPASVSPPTTIAAPSAPPSTSAAASSGAASGAVLGPAQPTAAAPTPPNNGRKIIQSAQLSLTAPSNRIDAVAQELFDVVGNQGGIVKHSEVTAGNSPNAYAEFDLSIPSANLSRTMASLSTLQYAKVSSRTDATQDVNNQYVGDLRKLADDRAMRTALLKQLANATTTEQIDSLHQQIHDVDGQISSDESTINTLNHQVNYSQVEVTINPGNIAPVASHRKGFTLGRAAHDAGRVLTVAAGVALITLAVLVPLGLVGAFGWWVVTAVRRRRREQALDLA
jgi:hypothetical protein